MKKTVVFFFFFLLTLDLGITVLPPSLGELLMKSTEPASLQFSLLASAGSPLQTPPQNTS